MKHYSLEEVAEAINWLDYDDMNTWLRVNAALYKGFEDAASGVADEWSARSDRYDAKAQKRLWLSFDRRPPRVGVGSIIFEARANGWHPRTCAREVPAPIPKHRVQRTDGESLALEAAKKARRMVEESTLETHPYLARKGFPEQRALVLGHELLIPMTDVRLGGVTSVQRIFPDGRKYNLTDGKINPYCMGEGEDTYFCEGYATGLSIRTALKLGMRAGRVVVCFATGNLVRFVDLFSGRRFVVADNDSHRTNAGEEAAKKTGLPYWMPPNPGDANDYHMTEGLEALAAGLAELRSYA